jgi:hypothetical protein
MRLAICATALLLALGVFASPVAAQQNQTQNQSIEMTGECVVSPNQSEGFMMCRYDLAEDQAEQEGVLQMLRERVEELFNLNQGNTSGMQGN